MTTTIFYFTGTGNSLAVAQHIAQHLSAKLVSIPAVMQSESFSIDTDAIGIVFPSYLAPIAGLPHIVRRFIQNIDSIDKHTIFAVCTCGGYRLFNALPALSALETAVARAGGTCRAAYSVRLPMNNLDYDHIPIPITKDSTKIILKSTRVIHRICMQIEQGRKTRFAYVKKGFLWLMQPMFSLIGPLAIRELHTKAKSTDPSLSVYDLMAMSDRSILVGEQCTGCGICEKICPVGNIRLVENKPMFQHHCEVCFACDEWCPVSAIQHWARNEKTKYHHPDISLKNMIE